MSRLCFGENKKSENEISCSIHVGVRAAHNTNNNSQIGNDSVRDCGQSFGQIRHQCIGIDLMRVKHCMLAAGRSQRLLPHKVTELFLQNSFTIQLILMAIDGENGSGSHETTKLKKFRINIDDCPSVRRKTITRLSRIRTRNKKTYFHANCRTGMK